MTLSANCDIQELMGHRTQRWWCMARETARYQRLYARLMAQASVTIPATLGVCLPRSPVKAARVVNALQEEIRRRLAQPEPATIWDRVLPPAVALLRPRMLLTALWAALIILLPLLCALPGLTRLLLVALALFLPEPLQPARPEPDHAPPRPPPLIVIPTIQSNAPNSL